MGFLDGLFGSDKGESEEVALADLGVWIGERLEFEAAGLLKESKGILASANEVLNQLRADVSALDEKGFDSIDPRYDKIVRTAKPSYVKSLRMALDGLEFSGESIQDVTSFEKKLSAALDVVGKSSFGDGKFLTFAFQDEMVRIQRGSRKLLDARDRLVKVISGNDRIGAYNRLKDAHEGYLGLKSQGRKVGEEAAALKAQAAGLKSRLSGLEAELSGIESGKDYADVRELEERLESSRSQLKSVESTIHSALSPLRHQLRKYEKCVLDNSQAKLVASIEENPVEGFLSADFEQVLSVLDGLDKACRTGPLQGKDSQKSLRNLSSAISTLSADLKTRHKSIVDEVADLEKRLGSHPVLARRRRLADEATGLRLSLEKSAADLAQAKLKADSLDAESKIRVKELGKSLSEIGFTLV